MTSSDTYVVFLDAPVPLAIDSHRAVVVTPATLPEETAPTPRHVLCVLLFHVPNALLGATGFATAVFGILFSVALLPLCCLGVAVLKMTAMTADVLASLDVHLANVVPGQNVQLKPSAEAAMESNPCVDIGCRDLALLSRRRVVTLVYFLAVKSVVSFFCIIAFAWSVVLPLQVLSGASATVIPLPAQPVPALSLLVAVGFWLLGIAGIVFVARCSRSLTKCFCADAQSADTSA